MVAGRKWLLSNQAVQGNFGFYVYGLEEYLVALSGWLTVTRAQSECKAS